MEIARSLWHPFDLAAHMPDFPGKCCFEHLTKSPMDVVKLRIARLKQWTQWAADLSRREEQYKSALDPRVRSLLVSMWLLLMQRVADRIGWPDTELLVSGSWDMPLVQMFPTRPQTQASFSE